MLAGPKTVLSAAYAQNRGAHATTPRRRDARGALLGQPDHRSLGAESARPASRSGCFYVPYLAGAQLALTSRSTVRCF